MDYRWYDRLRFWLVKKLGGEDPNESVRVTRIVVDPEDFMEKLFAQRESVLEHFGRETKQLLIGACDFEELMRTQQVPDMFCFSAGYYKDKHMCGLKVTVIPWMRGILVMP